MEVKDYIDKNKKYNKIVTTVRIDKHLFDKITELKGTSTSMTQLIEALLRRYADENKSNT